MYLHHSTESLHHRNKYIVEEVMKEWWFLNEIKKKKHKFRKSKPWWSFEWWNFYFYFHSNFLNFPMKNLKNRARKDWEISWIGDHREISIPSKWLPFPCLVNIKVWNPRHKIFCRPQVLLSIRALFSRPSSNSPIHWWISIHPAIHPCFIMHILLRQMLIVFSHSLHMCIN